MNLLGNAIQITLSFSFCGTHGAIVSVRQWSAQPISAEDYVAPQESHPEHSSLMGNTSSCLQWLWVCGPDRSLVIILQLAFIKLPTYININAGNINIYYKTIKLPI